MGAPTNRAGRQLVMVTIHLVDGPFAGHEEDKLIYADQPFEMKFCRDDEPEETATMHLYTMLKRDPDRRGVILMTYTGIEGEEAPKLPKLAPGAK